MPETPATRLATPAHHQPWLYAATGIVVGVLGTLIAIYGTQAFQRYNTPTAAFMRHNKSADSTVVETPSGLQYKILTPGTGTAKPTDSDIALMMYEGKLTDGTTFDKSQQPTPMKVSGAVPGFTEALKLMTKGAKYRFWLPPALGYGDKATGPIPANSVLQFDVTLLDWKSEAEIKRLQAAMMQQQMQQMQQQQKGAGTPPPTR
jgi:FKBP-type peptidyl-prolyl cis-trans isomerase FkpA